VQIYQHLKTSPSLITKLQTFIRSFKQQPQSSLEEFGLNRKQVEDAFVGYIENYDL
jgi:hypothetical protein